MYDCNKRAIVELKSPQFGEVLYVMIAAVQVGSIKLEASSGDHITKVCCFSLHSQSVCMPIALPHAVMNAAVHVGSFQAGNQLREPYQVGMPLHCENVFMPTAVDS